MRARRAIARRTAATGAALDGSEIAGEDYGSTHDFGEIDG